MKKILLIVPILLVSISSTSQNSPNDISEQFFRDFTEKGVSEAIDNLYRTNKWMGRAGDAIIQLKSQMEGLNEDYVGKYYGKELLFEKRLTDSYVLLSYLVKYERQPLRFTFQFYKPNDKWVVYSFKFDGGISEEIEEAAKLYNFRLN
ncbi:hypothetical protein H7U19_11540 [Hyunsoonleella sp. SJ7]|uniref:DUF3887 domain-containing protein n=1 Tax=Hyunsoonleella aquatilis TaxID=2762758 RepID=A0A923HF04_9FLAO|nr:hypothetical protein [Hyunsoonleella aquatilis]MBC3759043.1 hypothetical protein [Hyunsoonleella aquatilis]